MYLADLQITISDELAEHCGSASMPQVLYQNCGCDPDYPFTPLSTKVRRQSFGPLLAFGGPTDGLWQGCLHLAQKVSMVHSLDHESQQQAT